MISLNDRSVLTDALTPPAGFEFDSGFISTYSLDLVTLLGLPLHLAWMASTTDGEGPPEALAVIESMRRVAGRLTVFCQRARIHAPRVASSLLGLVEPVVREVVPPHGGVFHPKVWLLKFVRNESDDAKLVLMVSSRNVTEDASWDVCLRLEGARGKKPTRANSDIKRLVQHAMKQSTKALPAPRVDTLNALAEDAACAEWEIPPRFDDVKFHLLGAGAKRMSWLPTPSEGTWDSLGIVSPFVEREALTRLVEASRKPLFVVSRHESLQKISVLPDAFNYKTLSEQASVDDDANEDADRDRGLHAKIFAAKRGWNTHLFVGSANATNAALVAGINTEFMAELIGRANAANKAGPPDALIQEQGLGPLLRDFERTATSAQEDAIEAVLEGARDALAAACLRLDCVHDEFDWTLNLSSSANVRLGRVEVVAWPVTIRKERALRVAAGGAVSTAFKGMLAHEITSLMAFRLCCDGVELSFTLDLELAGAPPDRDLEILRAAVKNRDGFVRYLLLLLGDWQPFGDGGGDKHRRGKRAGANSDDPAPLFELMARSLAHDPARLNNITQVIERLRHETSDGETIIPPEFMEVWASFDAVMREVQQ